MLCIALVTWWHATFPEYRNALIHIPNGAYFSGTPAQRARQGSRLKAEGMRIGASDYFIALPRGGYHGMWLEIKIASGKPTQDQLDFLNDRAADGYRAEWTAGIDAARNAISDYMRMPATTNG